MNARALMQLLSALPPETLVLVDGYEDGFSPIDAVLGPEPMQELANRSSWYGRFELVADATRLLAAAPGSRILAGDLPATPVGEPVSAIVLGRERG